jgi:uncharacterized damage-inducible protein DinB
MSMREILLSEFDHETATARRLLDRLPDAAERLAWRPHPKSMSLGGLATHVANLPTWTGAIVNEPFFDLAAAPPSLAEQTSRGGILGAFDENVARARGWVAGCSDAEYAARWTLRRNGQEMFSLPRGAALRTFVISHLVHHRGQLSVYLRLLDIPVPAIYGPSADEGQSS